MVNIITDFLESHTTGETCEEYGARQQFVYECARQWLFGETPDDQMSPWKMDIADTYATFAMSVMTEYLCTLKGGG